MPVKGRDSKTLEISPLDRLSQFFHTFGGVTKSQTFHLTKIFNDLYLWPASAPQSRLLGGVKGHNMNESYITGKPRRVGGELHKSYKLNFWVRGDS